MVTDKISPLATISDILLIKNLMYLFLLWNIKGILFMRDSLPRVRLLRMRGLLWSICLGVGISRKMLCFLGDLLVGLLRFRLRVISKQVVLSY